MKKFVFWQKIYILGLISAQNWTMFSVELKSLPEELNHLHIISNSQALEYRAISTKISIYVLFVIAKMNRKK